MFITDFKILLLEKTTLFPTFDLQNFAFLLKQNLAFLEQTILNLPGITELMEKLQNSKDKSFESPVKLCGKKRKRSLKKSTSENLNDDLVKEEEKEGSNKNALKNELSLPAMFEEVTKDHSVSMIETIVPAIQKRSKSRLGSPESPKSITSQLHFYEHDFIKKPLIIKPAIPDEIIEID